MPYRFLVTSRRRPRLMSSAVRLLLRSLIAVLASIAIARTPTAFSAPAATGGSVSIVLSPSAGPSRTGVHVGFASCVRTTTGPTGPTGSGTTQPSPTPTGPTTPPSTAASPGPAGRGVHARAGPAPGTITYLRWDGGDVPFTASVTDGTGSAEFRVPDGATVGPHSVTAGCDNGSVTVAGAGTFTVTPTSGGSASPSAHAPLIALEPSQGRPGASLQVYGAGFEGCVPSGKPGTVELSTNGQIHARVRVAPGTGMFQTQLKVADDATPGDYPMVATCARHRDVQAKATFTVLPGDEGRPVLMLDPAEGDARTALTATGSGFNCSKVEVLWDDDTPLAVTAVSRDGTFATDFQVPAGASRATHMVRAACTPGSGTSAGTQFTVTGAGPNTGGGDGGNTGGTGTGGTGGGTGGGNTSTPVGWVVGPSAFAAVLLALAAGSILFSHRHPGPRWVRKHLRTAPRPAAGTADLHQQSDTGSANRTVRLEPHPDPGDQNLE
ncbi:hypothetical protein [Streptomyces sp. NPDC048191]|uniref:hypothetical protein n=1 Tax=Streptomyces sp. NPDC048191 TaxID=3155484 RepID=UPI0033E3DA8B